MLFYSSNFIHLAKKKKNQPCYFIHSAKQVIGIFPIYKNLLYIILEECFEGLVYSPLSDSLFFTLLLAVYSAHLFKNYIH